MDITSTLIFEPDERLFQRAEDVTEFGDALTELVRDMFAAMYANAGIGLAANQIGDPRRVFVMDLGGDPVAFVNPRIVAKSGIVVDEEGCLSVPDETHRTRRPRQITVKAQTIEGVPFKFVLSGLAARCVCHEVDHLNGKLYR